MQNVTEIERKFLAEGEARALDWSRLIRGSEPAVERRALIATYLDTGDLRLSRAGITLRRRVGDAEAGWQLKVPVGKDSRQELRSHADGGIGDSDGAPPAELAGLLRSVLDEHDLRPVAAIRTDRRLLRWSDASGAELLTVVDDRVMARKLPGRREQHWREIEVELGSGGGLQLLDRADSMLAAAGIHRSADASKLARVLGDRDWHHVRGRHAGRRRAGQVVMAYVGRQVAAIHRSDVAVRAEFPDAVHQLRVSCRRLRSTLQVYPNVLDRTATEDLAQELKWLGAVAGHARDLEVMRARLSEQLHRLPDQDLLGPVQRRIAIWFAPRQAESSVALLAALDSDRYRALQARLDVLMQDPPLTAAAARDARKVLSGRLRKAHRRVRRHLDRAPRNTGSDRDVEWHEARKAAKRLRYAAEAATPALGSAGAHVAKRAKTLQDILGEHQDAVVSAPVLRAVAVAAHGNGENEFAFGVLHGQALASAPDRDSLAVTARKLDTAVHRLGR